MVTLRKAAEQALAAIKSANQVNYSWACVEAVAVLEAALAEEALQRLTSVSQEIETALTEPKQEPFAYYFETYSYEGQKDRWFVACPCDGKLNGKPGMPLYTAPPQQTTEQEPVFDCPRCGHCCPQIEQEPVAWMDRDGDVYPMPENKKWAPPHTMLYTAPPQRKPLSDEHPLMVFAKECVLGAYSEKELADAANRAIKYAHSFKGEA